MAEENYNLYAESVDDIISKSPSWVIRWGILVIFLLIMCATILSILISYPDVLTSELKLTTINPPVSVVAKSAGKISHLLVSNNQVIKANFPLAILENSANHHDVAILSDFCDKTVKQILIDTFLTCKVPTDLEVGDLTTNYISVITSIKKIQHHYSINSSTKQIQLLKKDLQYYVGLLKKYQIQSILSNEQTSLAKKDLLRDSVLFLGGSIPLREEENKKIEFLKILNQNEQSKIVISNALLQINSIHKNILALTLGNEEERTKLKMELQENIKNLSADIKRWKMQYVISSPIAGKVSFFSIWAVNQNIEMGDEIFFIVPAEKQELIGKCLISIENSGKLAIGQMANIKLKNYSSTENGILSGKIKNISIMPNKEMLAVDLTLSKGLKTSYGKILPYQQEMAGTADIIVKNISVFDRIFFNFRKLLIRS